MSARHAVGHAALVEAIDRAPDATTGFVDWRGVRAPKYAPPIDARVDEEGGLLCASCGASLAGRTARARFCDHACRSRFHGRAQYRAKRQAIRERRAAKDAPPRRHLGVTATGVVECTPRPGMWDGHPRRDICRIHGGPLRRRRGRWVHA